MPILEPGADWIRRWARLAGRTPDGSVSTPALLVPPESLAKAPLFDISGRYDHPAAASCASTDPKGVDATVKAEIVLGCRLQFVVTSATPSAG